MPEPAKPIVSALVVSHNAKDELLQCLKTFFASADVPVEAVVVDNDSSDGSPAAVTNEFPQATVLVQSKNLGYGRAANLGLARCEGRFVLLLSPHVTLDPQCVGRLADFLLTRPDAGARRPYRPTGGARFHTSATGRCGHSTSSTTRRRCPPSAMAWCGRRSGVATRPNACATPCGATSAPPRRCITRSPATSATA